MQSIPPEGPEDEWKEEVPRPDRMARTLAAFSNGTGGRIWIGMSDDGRPVGVPNFAIARDAIGAAADLVDPAPDISFHRISLPGDCVLLRVDVPSGQHGPYCVVGREGDRAVYLRNRDSTRPLPESEMERLGNNSEHISLAHKDWRLLELIQTSDGLAIKALAQKACMGERDVRRRLVSLHRAGLTSEVPGRGHTLTPRGFKRCRERKSGGP